MVFYITEEIIVLITQEAEEEPKDDEYGVKETPINHKA